MSLVSLAVVPLGCVTAGTAGAASAKRQLTVYAVTSRAQYVDFSDGITRAQGHNPFNTDVASLPPTKAKGASPGNSIFFTFKLYSDASLKQRIGSATYTCTFNFNQQATCDADYDLGSSTLFAAGPVDFAGSRLTLAVTGGTGTYLGASGEVATSSPGPKPTARNESRLNFDLLG